jgi:hypothetical protein
VHDELLIQGAAIDADANRLAVIGGDLTDSGELLVAPLAGADVARVDPVLVECVRALGVLRQQDVAVVVKISDEGGRDTRIEHPLLDGRHRCSRLGQVHRNAHELGTGLRQLDALARGRIDVGRIRVRHRLDGNRSAAADVNRPDFYADRLM